MQQLRVPRDLHYRVADHGGVIVLNAVTGQWHALNPTAGELWRSWRDGHGFEESTAALANKNDGVPVDRIRAEANQLVADLTRRGLIESGPPADPRTPVRTPDLARPERSSSGPARTLSFVVLLLAVFLVRLPFRLACSLVRASRGRWCRTAVSAEQAGAIVTAVRRAAALYPGRAACMEVSLASVLIAALLRQRLDWCLGALSDPYRFHAWVEADGVPIPTTPDPEDTGYMCVLAI
jgi:hypothetical protein